MYKNRDCDVINDPYLVLILTVTFDLKWNEKGNKKNKDNEQWEKTTSVDDRNKN